MPSRLPRTAGARPLALALAWTSAITQLPAQSPAPSPASAAPIATYSHAERTTLGQRINTLLADPRVARAHWGIAVTALDGTPLYGLDEAKLFRPASTAKLFTTAAAMAVLGPEHTVITTITGNLDPATGELHGDLNLVGAGDPSFGTNDLPYNTSPGPSSSNDLPALADQLLAKGLRHVTGSIVGNDLLFRHELPPEGWAAEDLLWGYGALPSALSLADNEVAITIRPAKLLAIPNPGKDSETQISVAQLTPYFTIHNELTTNTREFNSEGVGIATVEGSPRILDIFGAVAFGSPPVVEHIAINDPAQYAAEALRDLLRQRGVEIDGQTKAMHKPLNDPEPYLQTWRKAGSCGWADSGEVQNCSDSCPAMHYGGPAIASHTSAPLAQEIAFTLKTSANLHAELLVRQLGLKNSCTAALAVNGARLIRTFLLHTGIADGDFVFYDGSGLSTKDLVTPRAEAQLLAYAATQPWFPQWKAALPVGGVDGTLANRFTTNPLKGHVFAKTGTLGESRALAGYVQCASGHEVIFSILVDNHEPATSEDRTTMDKIVAAIAAEN